ncbi:MAG TPA: glycosyltransferase family 2 protein, partial [Acidimicrobiales bacterium]|nr:glycosyltransferase family 2 protein [Acidimicrobiales bacterium]
MTQPRVTAVVVSHNRRSTLLPTLAHLSEDGVPVIVVDNGSTDGTSEAVLESFPDVDVLRSERNLGAAGRNLGVARASTPYVAFNDDDSWWAPGALERAADLFDRSPRLGLLAARVEVGPERTVDPTSVAMANSPIPPEPDLPGPSVLGFLACGAVVRRSAYLDVGGFCELLFFFGEETVLALDLAQAGWGLAYVDDVVAYHHPPPRPDGGGRRHLAVRNHLLGTWMRRPARRAVQATVRAVRAARADPEARRGVFDALGSLPAALRQRRVIDADVDRRLQLLEVAGG